MSFACDHNILLKNYLFHKLDAKSGVIVLFGNTDSAGKDGYQRHDLDIKFVTGTGVQIFLFSQCYSSEEVYVLKEEWSRTNS